MAKEIIYPTNENEILAGKTRYTKTAHGITDWDFWFSYGDSISKLNPMTEIELSLFERKEAYDKLKSFVKELNFSWKLPPLQISHWMESKKKSYFERAFALPGTSIYYYRQKESAREYVDNLKCFTPQLSGSNSIFSLSPSSENLNILALECFDSEFVLSNGYDSFFIHSSIRCVNEVELSTLIDSKLENVNLHNKRIKAENSIISSLDFDGEVILKNSELCDTLIDIKSNLYSTSVQLENLKLHHCRIISDTSVDYQSTKGLVLEHVTIYDFRTQPKSIELTKEMVIDHVIILGQ